MPHFVEAMCLSLAATSIPAVADGQYGKSGTLSFPLGSRLAQLRKELDLSQQAVADALGIAQQTYAHYEVGRLRMPLSLVPKVVELFGVGADELLGLKSAPGKRGPASLLQQKIERLSRLPKAKQKVVLEMLDGVLSQSR